MADITCARATLPLGFFVVWGTEVCGCARAEVRKPVRASARWKPVSDGRVPCQSASDVAACWLRVPCYGACASGRSVRRVPCGRTACTTSCPLGTSTPSSSKERVSAVSVAEPRSRSGPFDTRVQQKRADTAPRDRFH
ncbi:unnamed protein product, partial [Iphiclides podalirius]